MSELNTEANASSSASDIISDRLAMNEDLTRILNERVRNLEQERASLNNVLFDIRYQYNHLKDMTFTLGLISGVLWLTSWIALPIAVHEGIFK